MPVERIMETVARMTKMNAAVTQKIYPNMGHTISEDEIEKANNLIFTP
jgi:phospholipase/carboxylesterase